MTGCSVFGERMLGKHWYIDPPRISRMVKDGRQHSLQGKDFVERQSKMCGRRRG